MGSANKSEAEGPELAPPRPDDERSVSSASSDLPRVDAPQNPVVARPLPIWMQRFTMLVQVILFLWAGCILIVLPWKFPDIWLYTPFVATRPALHDFLADNFVRGLISGLGVVDVWLGLWLAVHYRDRK